MNNEILFSETQRFKQWWLWLILLAVNGLFLFGLFVQVIVGRPFGDKPMNNTGLFISTGVCILLTVLFLNFRLNTQIKADGIYVRFFPIQFRYRHYTWDKISKIYLRHYSPIYEYGGWGMRLGFLEKEKPTTFPGPKGCNWNLPTKKSC